jgi:hypothetical protein
MAMKREEMDRKMDEHFGFEAKDDVEGVLRTLAPDAIHDIVGWPKGPSHKPQDIRAFYETLYADLAGEKVTCTKRLYGENFLIDESVWKGKAIGRPYGLEGKGRPVEIRLLHVIEFRDDGQMTREQVWADLATLQQQLPQE